MTRGGKTARIHAGGTEGLKIKGFGRSVHRVDDDKVIDLQSRIAHQEHTIAELNDALTDQQAQIATLEAKVVALIDRVRSLSESAPAGDGGDEPPPPHY